LLALLQKQLGRFMLFRLMRIELNEQNYAVTQTETRPLFELREDAVMMAEFEAARCGGDYGYNRDMDCWWSRDVNGRRYRFEVQAIATSEAAA
jgi:hypothetical protein